MGNRLKELKLKKVKVEKARAYHFKHKFNPDMIPSLLEKEKERGRMAVRYFEINPSFSVRMTTLYWPPFFLLEKLLNLFNWPQWSVTKKLVVYLHQKNFF